ncbi:MAG TPA: HAD-IB family phosphatase [Gemmatimonadaceae bacterium]|nr:HAD-IB family phosphatase [Gemmatimonadaceae bacterium]
MPAFASVVLDVDSTVSGVEGIEWLASRRDPVVAAEVAKLTTQATEGEIALESVYGRRLEAVLPTEPEITELARFYERRLAPRAAEVITELREAGVRLVLVSGGIRQAVLPLGLRLGFTPAEVFAVRVTFNEDGSYGGFDDVSPLTTTSGKATVVQRLYLPRPLLAVGDGATDLAARPSADAFAAFTGFAYRPSVVRGADHELSSFDQLLRLVLT